MTAPGRSPVRDEAARLREARLLFERAEAAGITMQEARAREVRERWAEADRRLAARLAGHDVPPPGQWWQR